MPTTIFLARHATPDRSRSDLVYHQLPGPPLTEQGLQEAQALGAYFLSQRVRRIYSSPFERCRCTAEIAARVAGIPWSVEECLGEVQPGETPDEIWARTQPLLECLEQESEPQALVTHGGVIQVLLRHLGMEQLALAQHSTFDYGNPAPPAGVWLAERQDNAPAWSLRLVFKPEPSSALVKV